MNVALLSAFVIVKGFELGWKSLNISSRLDNKHPYKQYILISSIIILFSILFLVVYPFPFNAGQPYPQSLPGAILSSLNAAQYPLFLSNDWYKVLEWLKTKRRPGFKLLWII